MFLSNVSMADWLELPFHSQFQEHRDPAVQQYLADLRTKINPRNLQLYMDSFVQYAEQ